MNAAISTILSITLVATIMVFVHSLVHRAGYWVKRYKYNKFINPKNTETMLQDELAAEFQEYINTKQIKAGESTLLIITGTDSTRKPRTLSRESRSIKNPPLPHVGTSSVSSSRASTAVSHKAKVPPGSYRRSPTNPLIVSTRRLLLSG